MSILRASTERSVASRQWEWSKWSERVSEERSFPTNCFSWRSFLFFPFLSFPSLNWSHSCVLARWATRGFCRWSLRPFAISICPAKWIPSKPFGIPNGIRFDRWRSTRRSTRSFPRWMICTWEWLRHLFSHSPREWNICVCSSSNPNDCQSVIDQNWNTCTSVCSADSEITNIKIDDRLTVGNTSNTWSPCSTIGLVITLDSPCPPSLTGWNVLTIIPLIFTPTKIVRISSSHFYLSVRGIRPDVSRWTLAPSSGSLSQLLFSFSSVCSCSPTVSSLFVHEYSRSSAEPGGRRGGVVDPANTITSISFYVAVPINLKLMATPSCLSPIVTSGFQKSPSNFTTTSSKILDWRCRLSNLCIFTISKHLRTAVIDVSFA